MIAIPDDDEKSLSAEQEKKKNGEEPMETDKPNNGEAETVKEKDGEKKEGDSEKKSPEGGEETKSLLEAKTEGSEVKPEDSEVKGKNGYSVFFILVSDFFSFKLFFISNNTFLVFTRTKSTLFAESEMIFLSHQAITTIRFKKIIIHQPSRVFFP